MKNRTRFINLFTVAICALGLAACGGGDDDPKKVGKGKNDPAEKDPGKGGGTDPEKDPGDPGGTAPGITKRPDVNDSSVFPIKSPDGKYVILGIQTDGKDESRAQQMAADTITSEPEIACMVGLWAYNAPRILNAVEGAGRDDIAIISFDEHPATLDGIASGAIHGTIAQQPFRFGYRSAELLSAIVRGKEVNKEGEEIIVPVTVVKKDNVSTFAATVSAQLAGDGADPEPLYEDYPEPTEKVTIAFVTNGVDPFWDLAHEGFKLAAKKYNVEARFVAPAQSTVEEQNRMIEEQQANGVQAFAVSPIGASAQTEFLSKIGSKVPLICQDSDAPDSNRLFYLGTSNYLAGRAAGRLIKEAIPDGGKVMLFVGKMEVLNAQQRSQGVVDELLGLPIPR